MRRLLASASLVGLLGCQSTATANPADSGVGIVANGCAGLTNEVGSGVAIGRRGQVATAAHIVAGATTISVVTPDGSEFTATVSSLDKDSDLALLDVVGLEITPLELGETEVASAVAVVWSPDDGIEAIDVEITKRLSITIEDIYVEDEVQRSGFELSGDISVGDSGGAVIDDQGRVVGLIYARSRERPGVAFATDHAELERLLIDRPLDNTDRCR